MAHDYEDLHDLEHLDDSELRGLVQEQLAAHSGLVDDEITVEATNGKVTLSGRVGTDEERRIADHVLTDVIGLESFTNDLIVDPNYRAETPEAADEMVAEADPFRERSLDDSEVSLTDDSGQLADRASEDPDGSSDIQEVMDEGVTWNPPDAPTPEGLLGTDAGPGEMGERH